MDNLKYSLHTVYPKKRINLNKWVKKCDEWQGLDKDLIKDNNAAIYRAQGVTEQFDVYEKIM